MPNTTIHPNATHVSALVAFAPNGADLKNAFDWIPVEAEANVSDIVAAARRKAGQFMSFEKADTSTCYVTEILQQWDANGIAI